MQKMILRGVFFCFIAMLPGTTGKSRGMDLVQAGRLKEAVQAFAEQARASGSAVDFYNMALAASQVGLHDQVADALVEALFAKVSSTAKSRFLFI
jgi:hypothetical protein